MYMYMYMYVHANIIRMSSMNEINRHATVEYTRWDVHVRAVHVLVEERFRMETCFALRQHTKS